VWSSSRSNSFRVRHSGARLLCGWAGTRQWNPRRSSASAPPSAWSWLGRHPLLCKNICRRGMMAGSARHHRGNVLKSAGSGEFPAGGPSACMNSRRKICRGFFDSYRDRSRVLLILQAGRRLAEVPPPLVAKAEELGRDAGNAAAGWVSGGNTPGEEYQRVLRGIEEGGPAVLGATEPPRDRPRGRVRPGRPRPRPRHRARRPLPAPGRVRLHRRLHRRLLAGNRAGRPRPRRLEPGTASIMRPGEKRCPAKRGAARERIRQYGDTAGR
jgi:hypothetical protein